MTTLETLHNNRYARTTSALSREGTLSEQLHKTGAMAVELLAATREWLQVTYRLGDVELQLLHSHQIWSWLWEYDANSIRQRPRRATFILTLSHMKMVDIVVNLRLMESDEFSYNVWIGKSFSGKYVVSYHLDELANVVFEQLGDALVIARLLYRSVHPEPQSVVVAIWTTNSWHTVYRRVFASEDVFAAWAKSKILLGWLAEHPGVDMPPEPREQLLFYAKQRASNDEEAGAEVSSHFVITSDIVTVPEGAAGIPKENDETG